MQFRSSNSAQQPLGNINNILIPITMTKNHQILHHHNNLVSNSNGSTEKSDPTIMPRHWFPTSSSSLSSAKGVGSGGASTLGDANCMEQLLVHCANAIESNDVTLAQQILWVLNNIAPPDGDANQRLACGFLRALVSRAARSGTCNNLLAAVAATSASAVAALQTHRFSAAVELASFIDLTPWHRFGFTAANSAILHASEGFPVVHIVDVGLTHCMQFPTLLDAFASRHVTPPLVKLTVAVDTSAAATASDRHPPPALDLSYDQLGLKLVNFARSRNVTLEFRAVGSSYADGFASLVEQLHLEKSNDEALVINCHMKLHHIPDEADNSSNDLRTMFLKALRSLGPTAVVLVDEDADLTSDDLVSRLRSAFNYLWIPYDTVDTFLPKGSEQRRWYEADICWKIENVLANEGLQRVERLEPRAKWASRMRTACFRGARFTDEVVAEVKAMLDEHAAGWGVKREEEDLVLTWKGHNVVFATLWVPS